MRCSPSFADRVSNPSPRLLSNPVTGPDRKDAPPEEPDVPWHNRTSTVLAVSVAGLAAIAILVTAINYVSRQFSEPEQAPINYVGPMSSLTSTRSSTTGTTTATISSTRPPLTSDINPDGAPSSTTVPEASTRNPETTTRNPNYRPPRTRDNDSSAGQTTRSRPRANLTRTLSPAR